MRRIEPIKNMLVAFKLYMDIRRYQNDRHYSKAVLVKIDKKSKDADGDNEPDQAKYLRRFTVVISHYDYCHGKPVSFNEKPTR